MLFRSGAIVETSLAEKFPRWHRPPVAVPAGLGTGQSAESGRYEQWKIAEFAGPGRGRGKRATGQRRRIQAGERVGKAPVEGREGEEGGEERKKKGESEK